MWKGHTANSDSASRADVASSVKRVKNVSNWQLEASAKNGNQSSNQMTQSQSWIYQKRHRWHTQQQYAWIHNERAGYCYSLLLPARQPVKNMYGKPISCQK